MESISKYIHYVDLDLSDVNQCNLGISLLKGLAGLFPILHPFLPGKFPTYNTILYAVEQLQFLFYVFIKECACESLRCQIDDLKGFPQTVSFLSRIMSDVALLEECNF